MIVPLLLAIRPEPGLAKTLARARTLGLPVQGFPLFAIGPVAWDAPDATQFDGLLIGSGNALGHAGEAIVRLAALPVYAVGAETAACAVEAGFRVARTGEGRLQSVLDALAGRRLHLLRLTGREHVPLLPPPGIFVTTQIVYEVVGKPLPTALAEQLRQAAIVLLHSGGAAAHFAAECDRLALPRDRIGIAALAPRIFERAGTGWRTVTVAASPNDAALLAAAAQMCKEWR